MTWVDLVLTVCLASDTSVCRTEHILLANRTQKACMTHAQVHIAEWIGNQPEYKVVKWECANPDGPRRI